MDWKKELFGDVLPSDTITARYRDSGPWNRSITAKNLIHEIETFISDMQELGLTYEQASASATKIYAKKILLF